MTALFQLLRLQGRAVLRRMFRGIKTPRGLTFFIVGVVMFFMWFAGTISNAFLMPRADPQIVRTYFPLAMLGFVVMSLITTAGERAVAFAPAEVDFLFPGPFSRRQLLGYKIARSAFAAIFTALLFSFILLRYSQHWIGGFVAVFLGLIFLQLLSMAITLIGQTIGERAFSSARKLALIGCLIAIAAITLPHELSSTPHDFREIVDEFMHSTSGRVVLAPLSFFGRIMTADPIFPDALKSLGIVIVEIGILLLIVMKLDAHYLEAAAKSGQQVYDRTQRFRRGGGVAFRASGARLRLPMLPRLGGAGAIAWRQLTTALRTTRAMLVILIFVCIAIGPVLYLGHTDKNIANVLVGIVFWVTFMLGNMLRFDFRGDLDHIDTLKALPVPAWRIAVAQLIAPVFVLTIYQFLLLASISVMLHTDPRMLGLVMLFALPMNALLMATENLIFLVFPVRAIAVSPGDLQGMGRQMLVFLLKGIALFVAAALAAAVGAGAWFIAGKSTAVFLGTTFAMLVVEVIATIPLLVLAFGKFDPSVDTPA